MRLFQLIISLVLVFSFFPHTVDAARFFVSYSESEPYAHVRIDTEGERLNAFEGVLVLPDGVSLRRVEDSNSIITVWLARPEKTAQEVRFSGITPGGYLGESGLLFTLVFEEGVEGILSFRDIEALYNDGVGTSAVIEASPSEFSFSESNIEKKKKDTVPPESFALFVGNTADAFDGKRFLAFSTQDKGSGIASYRVCEELFFSCREAQSPYVLDNQKADAFSVTAYDYDGNARSAFLFTEGAFLRYGMYLIALILILGALAAFFFRKRHA